MAKETVVRVKCCVCDERRTIRAGELSGREIPMCPKDGMPMVVLGAKSIKTKEK